MESLSELGTYMEREVNSYKETKSESDKETTMKLRYIKVVYTMRLKETRHIYKRRVRIEALCVLH
jgi:hypothetical protein